MSFKISYSLTDGRIRVAVYSKRRFIVLALMTVALVGISVKKINEKLLGPEIKVTAPKISKVEKKESKQ